MVATLVMLFLCCATALTILMLSKVIGPFRFFFLSPAEASLSFGLWVPNSTGIETRNRIRAWREITPPDRALVESSHLAELRDQHVRSIAIPDARALGPFEIEELRSYLAAGGGVVLTGSIGVSRPDGTWRGYDQMKALLHVSEIQQVTRQASISIGSARRGPISAALAPRSRIPLIAEIGMPAVESPSAELRWDPAPTGRGRLDLGASRRVQIGPGRIAWLATGPENAREGASEPWHPMLQLLRSAIAWSARLPRLEVLPWPDGAAFAAKYVNRDTDDPATTPHLTNEADILAEIEWTHETSGLVLLALGESANADGHRTPSALKGFARTELRRRNAWIAADGAIQSWSRIHSSFRVSFRQPGPRRIQVDVTNGAREPAEKVVVRLHVNRPVIAASSAKTRILQDAASVRFEERAEWIDLVLPELQPRSSTSYFVDFELVSDLSGNFENSMRLKIDGQTSPVHVRL